MTLKGISKELIAYRIKNLSKLLDVLNRPLPEGAVHDQGVFGRHPGNQAPQEQNYCGTTACAFGWFALSPEGKTCGITYKWLVSRTSKVAILDIEMDQVANPLASEIRAMWTDNVNFINDSYSELTMMALTFGIDLGESNQLFGNHGTRETVCATLREMIKEAYDEAK